ncbi:NAD(P)/FAD-dependent oxidoreductase [Pseudoxanthomonas wuyuanensis]|uniref:D-amino acid dehydrogenase small subunit n=1 Tax=Pseudoxanthomonas wuyuanensis TaxID=1073196 RepID=A0A286DE31_9GAMM|nr:FAD-dependent oxidoreductase [Pseudoxanthomonas wuyuanensis]KAF1720025.1 FAD-dependent oxidoreductase [Pseudoxanthomonas wuyuanensis]SOD56910.1 D-amino acid dehydrogenase small subunit [Pseudoxanthomonas wuyuanensis]
MNSPHDDVLIIGAGAIGLSTALALLESGRGVRVLDSGRIGGGASHGNCGTITPSHAPPLAAPGVVAQALRWMLTPDAPLYLKPRFDPALWRWLARFAARCNLRDWRSSTRARAALLNDSSARLAAWVRDYALDCEYRTGGLDYVFRQTRNFERYSAECDALAEFGIASEIIGGNDYLRADPALREGVVGAIRFPGDARLRPDRYAAELARAVRERGGIIEEQCEVADLQPAADGVSVSTALGRRRGRDAVVALGAWSPAFVRRLGLDLPIQPGKGYSITYSRPAQVPRHPLVLKDRSVCVTVWDSGFRLGSTMEFAGQDTRLNEVRLAALERAAREYLCEPVGAHVEERWYGWRPMTWDDLPVLGRAPGYERLWLAAGHGMLGISMSAGSGQLMADLIGGRAPAIDPEPYRMERFA